MSEERLILPYNARVEDLDQIAEYLRSRPTGATHSQIARTLGRKIIDDRKVHFFLLTGFIMIDGEQWRLSSKGSEYVHGDAPARQLLLWGVLRNYPPYHEILSWVYHRSKTAVTADEVRLKWANDFSGAVSTENKYRLNGAPLTLFGLCQHAQLGRFIVGRRGAVSRLEVDEAALRDYFDSSGERRKDQDDGEQVVNVETSGLGRSTPTIIHYGHATTREAPQEFAFPLSNNKVISIMLPDEIPSRDTENLKMWFDLMLGTRTKTAKN